MDEDDIKLSEMSAVVPLGTSLLYMAVLNTLGEYVGGKVTAEELANLINNSLQYAGLNTTAKTILGAINELQTGGGGGASVLYGTTAPTAAQGTNGSLYVQYETTGGVDSIIGVFCKINNNWLNFPTSGSLPDAEGVGF